MLAGKKKGLFNSSELLYNKKYISLHLCTLSCFTVCKNSTPNLRLSLFSFFFFPLGRKSVKKKRREEGKGENTSNLLWENTLRKKLKLNELI